MFPAARMSVLLLALTLFTPFLSAQDAPVPLDIEGDTVLVVKTLPCKIRAEKGWQFYDWDWPVNVKVSKNDDVLTVIEAPTGEYVVSVVMMTIDITVEKDTLKVTQTKRKKFGQIKFAVGVAPKPPDPVLPQTALGKAFQDAYNVDTSPKKAEYLKFMTNFFDGAGALVDKTETPAGLFASVTAGLRADKVGIPKPDFNGCIQVAAKYFTDNIGTSGALDKVKAKAAFSELSKALATVKTTAAHKHLERK